MKIGITGHQVLDQPSEWRWVRRLLDEVLDDQPPPLIGITSLAIGADQIFANAVLRHGGSLQTILPFAEYDKLYNNKTWRRYLRLLEASEVVEVLEANGNIEEAFLAAGKYLVEECDAVVAVWDGKPSRGLGGTADIVAYARACKKPLILINPVDHVYSVDGLSSAAHLNRWKRSKP